MSESLGFQWQGSRLERCRPEASVQTLVSDSWLVDEGVVLALEVHRERFVAAVRGVDETLIDEAEGFWAAVVDELPRTGAWFPRVDLCAGRIAASFRLALRQAPERRVQARLATATRDPRTTPRVKGPDLAALGGLGDEARAVGADDAVILSTSGHIVEGHYSALLWWRGDVLCVVDDGLPRLDSVTERSLVTLATALGVEVAAARVTPLELEGCEVWLAGSLHGLRIATDWRDGPALAAQPGRLRLWRSRLDALRKPLPAPAAATS